MNARVIAAGAVKVVASLGVSTVISGFIEEHLPEREAKLDKALQVIGVIVLTGFILAIVTAPFDAGVDKAFGIVKTE